MGRRSTGGVDLLASGLHRARITVHGERRVETFPTREDAEIWLLERQLEDRLPRDTDWRSNKDRGQVTFREYSMELLAGRQASLKNRTQLLYARLMDRDLLPAFGSRPMIEISPEEIRAWHTGLAGGTAHKGQAYGLLTMIMNQAVRQQVIPSSPCVMPELRNRTVKREVQIASVQEIEELADLVPARYRLLVLLAGWSGLRFSELSNLRRADVLRDPLAIRVRVPIHKINGVWREDERHKTPAGRRVVHLPESLGPEIDAHLDAYVDDEPLAWLITTASGGHLARSNWSATFGRARKQIGREDLRFHDLRHTQATLSAQAGATQAELMARIGHSSQAASMLYQHASADRDTKLAEALDTDRQRALKAKGRTSQ